MEPALKLEMPLSASAAWIFRNQTCWFRTTLGGTRVDPRNDTELFGLLPVTFPKQLHYQHAEVQTLQVLDPVATVQVLDL